MVDNLGFLCEIAEKLVFNRHFMLTLAVRAVTVFLVSSICLRLFLWKGKIERYSENKVYTKMIICV